MKIHWALGYVFTILNFQPTISNNYQSRGMIFASHDLRELVNGRGFNSHSVHIFAEFLEAEIAGFGLPPRLFWLEGGDLLTI